ncbi:P-loop containing nucleoside triphosphate hydrolase protein [Mycena alexandri]|uniref:P-loop containing nucleoside triphosphate hydrolase protein n=1 Tax=Mycena alexandri TaxID=1745969 RepID=A0AAD6X8Q5_9AGAR|nr:P-loop containing nucleoside triphosphate hydrolase protein [Mycena alexandri]
MPPQLGGKSGSKRKAGPSTSSSEARKSSKKQRVGDDEQASWPQYFHDLFKVYKALNTVLAFVSSRKQLATSFHSIRASVENLLKRPLDLDSVAELKTLLPDLVKFAYIPRNEHLVHDDPQAFTKRDADFRLPASRDEEEERKEDHVLVLEFVDKSNGKKFDGPEQMLSAPPSLTPAAMKKLIEKRNERFMQAVNELILATGADDDPVVLLKAAARGHVPIDPSKPATWPKFAIPEPKDRVSIDAVLADIVQQEWYSEQIVERRTIDAKAGQIGTLDSLLSNTIGHALQQSRRISSFYTHQAAAINAINTGKHVIVSTSTASGKSVIYQVPLLQFLEANPSSTAVFVYPTKALAQDQRAALEQLIACCPGLEHLKVATYDGDTPQEHRAGIRQTASVIFTNFDMIHASILPHEDLWRTFLKNMKLFVVDELHYYSGIFGSHVAQITRRFRRVLAALGNRRAIFVSCSATISNPSLHMHRLSGIDLSDIEVVTEDGAPSGVKDYVIWDPPSNATTDRHVSSISEAITLMKFLMQRGVRTILFCKIRKVCELAMKHLRVELTKDGRFDILERVKSYRGGYSQEDRRRIEHDAFTGHLLGIIATNALELGVDIGVLDAVVMLGFPSSVASFRQQAGRAGRRARDSLALYVAEHLPIDQYYVNNPAKLFEGRVEDLVVNLDNEILLEAHLQCAAEEMPICQADSIFFGPLMQKLCDTRLRVDKDGWYHTHPKFLPFPSKHISIRGVQEDVYTVVDVTRFIQSGTMHQLEELEISRAIFEIYEGGVFIHQGLTYIVKEVSHDSKLAKVIRADINWSTSPRDFTNVDAIQTHRIKEIKDSPHRAFYGRIDIQVVVYGYFKIRHSSILDTVDLDSDPWERETTGFWIDVPTPILELLRHKGFKPAEAIHSAAHAVLNRFVLTDVKTECKAPEKENKVQESSRKRPARLIFYDAIGSVGGVSTKAFDNVHDLLCKAEKAITACACEDGCAKCIHSAACREKNEVSSKLGALLVLRGILDIPVDPTTIPTQSDAQIGHDTIVEPPGVGVITGVSLERADNA